MADKFQLKALITATDKLSPVLESQMKLLNRYKRQFDGLGKGALPMAAGLGAAMAIPVKAFADAENASKQLQNTLMGSNGLSPGFDALSKVATDLGNKLPGTTADFMSMASQLKSLGLDTDTITNGALKATAYLSVVGQNLGVTYESAAQAIGTLSNSMGIAAKDLVPFADSMQRALHVGVNLEDMQYAMSQAAGPLKIVGAQGLKTADDLVPLIALLSQAGIKGENAGTGLKKLIGVATKQGKFKDIPTLVHDLEKLQKLDPAKMSNMLGKLFGEEHASKAGIIAAGGYDQIVAKFKEQASMEQRVQNSLGSLANIWDSATGTFTNAMVAMAAAFEPELKSLAVTVGDLSGQLIEWANANGPTINMAVKMATAFVGLKVAFWAAGIGLKVLTGLMRTSPFGLLVQALAIAAPLIMDNWDKITGFFIEKWQAVMDFLQPGIDMLKYMLDGLSGALSGISMPDWMANAGQSVGDFFSATPNGMRPPVAAGQSQGGNSFIQSQRTSGSIDVNFNNTPNGTRVVQQKAVGPVAVTPNVGYRSLSLGLP